MSANVDDLNSKAGREFFGHPRGLSTLFMTEMWERLSYYGMRAILILYMTSELQKGGLGWDTKSSAAIYGLYTSSVWFLPLIGGWIADRFIGAKRATLIGGVIITTGHFLLAFPPIPFFYAGLICVATGTGFLKANISKMVGDLYSKDDDWRDAGFSIFYMGINIGALLAPFVTGTLAVFSWHLGFAAAGVGMFFGLVQYVIGYRHLKGAGERPAKAENEIAANLASPTYIVEMLILILITIGIIYFVGTPLMPTLLFAGLIAVLLTGMQDKLSIADWKRIAIIGVLFLFAMIFWMGFEQAGSSLTLFAEQVTDRSIPGFMQPMVNWLQQNISWLFGSDPITLFPTAWLQAVNPFFIVVFAPVLAAIWIKLGKKQPSEAVKFSLGLFFAGLGFVVLAYASSISGAGKVTPWFLVLVYLFHTFGELCLSPVGLSAMTKLAPGKMVSLMMGVWFLSISMGSYLGGLVAGEFEPKPDVLYGLFSKVAMVSIAGAVLLFLISPLVGRLYTKSEEVVPVEPA
jgi:POT family proton-dependent oligopeptide transporter